MPLPVPTEIETRLALHGNADERPVGNRPEKQERELLGLFSRLICPSRGSAHLYDLLALFSAEFGCPRRAALLSAKPSEGDSGRIFAGVIRHWSLIDDLATRDIGHELCQLGGIAGRFG